MARTKQAAVKSKQAANAKLAVTNIKSAAYRSAKLQELFLENGLVPNKTDYGEFLNWKKYMPDKGFEVHERLMTVFIEEKKSLQNTI